jgi:hypothetical protein
VPTLFGTFIALFLLASACSHFPQDRTKKIQIEDIDLELYTEGNGLPGNFLFSLSDHSKINKLPNKSYIAAVSSSGEVLFERSFEHRYRQFTAMNFKLIESNLYGYFLCFTELLAHREASYHFLDKKFRDIFPRVLPDNDPDLDPHDVLAAPNGNYFFIFYRPRIKDATIDIEIQEWTPSGEIVFSWRSLDHLTPLAIHSKLVDRFHINSIAYDSDGGLLVSVQLPSEIIKIEHSSGKILWTMSSRSWTFSNDPLGGFAHQHAVQRLENGNLLFFDNGEIYSRRPSRAVEYSIDVAKREAKLVWEYRASGENTFRQIGGSAQRLSNGNTIIGWGSPPENTPITGDNRLFTEVDPTGKIVREMTTSLPMTSYRVFFEETK